MLQHERLRNVLQHERLRNVLLQFEILNFLLPGVGICAFPVRLEAGKFHYCKARKTWQWSAPKVRGRTERSNS